MGRLANLSISQWFTDDIFDRLWVADADCGAHQDLPWIADIRPSIDQMAEMASICSQCPVIAQCAAYGLTTAGGFYAGVWLPWRPPSSESADLRLIRARARRELTRILEWAKGKCEA